MKFKNSNIKTIQARQKANKEIRQLKALTPKEFAKLVKDNENRKINEQEKELAKKIREIDDSVVIGKPTVEGIISEWWNTQVCNGQGHDLGVLVEIALNRSDEYWSKVRQR